MPRSKTGGVIKKIKMVLFFDSPCIYIHVYTLYRVSKKNTPFLFLNNFASFGPRHLKFSEYIAKNFCNKWRKVH